MKKQHKQSPDLIERTRATVTYLNTQNNNKEETIYAFLHLFHPNIPEKRKHQIAQTTRED